MIHFYEHSGLFYMSTVGHMRFSFPAIVDVYQMVTELRLDRAVHFTNLFTKNHLVEFSNHLARTKVSQIPSLSRWWARWVPCSGFSKFQRIIANFSFQFFEFYLSFCASLTRWQSYLRNVLSVKLSWFCLFTLIRMWLAFAVVVNRFSIFPKSSKRFMCSGGKDCLGRICNCFFW